MGDPLQQTTDYHFCGIWNHRIVECKTGATRSAIPQY